MFEPALEILEDPARVLIVSDALWLEVIPKTVFAKAKQSPIQSSLGATRQITMHFDNSNDEFAWLYDAAGLLSTPNRHQRGDPKDCPWPLTANPGSA